MTEREQFEAWMKSLRGYPFAGQFANFMWMAWQAARAPQSATGAAGEQYCKRCEGSGSIPTGIAEASESSCVKCGGTGYAAPQPARQGMGDDAPGAEQLERALHYPDHWDTAAYPDVYSALREVMAHFTCECEAAPQSAVQDSAVRDAWQPIESAPKDGTWIMLFARYPEATASTPHFGYYCGDGKWETSNRHQADEIIPSHWMPRPEFPA